ncbi:MAG: FCD domain-containing protein, partial [Kiloniellales bacterium]|nr:FCD domain-containing protein [Kiloniellales bacterium]
EASMVRSFVERASDSQVKSLEKALQRVATAALKSNVVAYSNALVELTNVILAGADNELASQVLSRLRARMTYLRVITARAASREQREGTIAALTAVVEAIATRDADAAERLLKAYVARSASFALQLLKEIEVDQGADEPRAQGRGA